MVMTKKDRLLKLDQALKVGEIANHNLAKLINELERAARWGLFDVFKGKVITTFFKQRKIQKAQAIAVQTEYALREFSRILIDLEHDKVFDFTMKKPFVLVDYLFDNAVVDFFVQSQINGNLKRAKRTKGELEKEIRQLAKEKRKLLKEER